MASWRPSFVSFFACRAYYAEVLPADAWIHADGDPYTASVWEVRFPECGIQRSVRNLEPIHMSEKKRHLGEVGMAIPLLRANLPATRTERRYASISAAIGRRAVAG